MSEIISEEKLTEGIRQLDWLIENSNEDINSLQKDKKDLQRFHENFYGQSANENINGGKSKIQNIETQNILIKAKLTNINAKYNRFKNSSNNKK